MTKKHLWWQRRLNVNWCLEKRQVRNHPVTVLDGQTRVQAINRTDIYSFCWKSAADGVKDNLSSSDTKTPFEAPVDTSLLLQRQDLLDFFLIPLTTCKLSKRNTKMESWTTFSWKGIFLKKDSLGESATITVKGSNIKKCSSPHVYNAVIKKKILTAVDHTGGASGKTWRQNYLGERFAQVRRCESDLWCSAKRTEETFGIRWLQDENKELIPHHFMNFDRTQHNRVPVVSLSTHSY